MNAAQLASTLTDSLRGTRLIVVANREPYIHMRSRRTARGLWNWLRGRKETERIEWTRPASGLVTALDPVMRACGGTWIAHGSGNADRETVDERDRLRVPPDRPSYTLRRVWLTRKRRRATTTAAPTTRCGRSATSPTRGRGSTPADWEQYRAVNRRFADAVLEEARRRPRRRVRAGLPLRAAAAACSRSAARRTVVASSGTFPGRTARSSASARGRRSILDGLLGNDLLGFHVQYHCNNFLDTVDRALESRVDYERFAVMARRPADARAAVPDQHRPDVVERPSQGRDRSAETPPGAARCSACGTSQLIVGVDRLDYTKGIPDRLQAFDRLLEQHPECARPRSRFVQVGAPAASTCRPTRR